MKLLLKKKRFEFEDECGLPSDSLTKKADEIRELLDEEEIDLWRLRELALSEGGLVNDTLRKRAWPRLLGIHDIYRPEGEPPSKRPRGRSPAGADVPRAEIHPHVALRARQASQTLPTEPTEPESNTETGLSLTGSPARRPPRPFRLPRKAESLDSFFTGGRRSPKVPVSMDADQIGRDVARSTWHLLTGSQRFRRLQMEYKHKKRVAAVLRKKQQRLGNLLNITLVRSYPMVDSKMNRLRYYQGFHDVASVCMAVLSGVGLDGTVVDDPVQMVASKMGLDMPSRVLAQLGMSHFADALRPDFILLQTALRLTIFPLLAVLDPQVHDHLWMCEMEPFFALSWIITWFSHDVRDTDLVKRLFDAFIVSHPLLPLYVSVAMVCHPFNRMELLQTECDFASVHQCLAGLPKNSSRVGWKYRPGEGYVSGEDDDDQTVSTDMDVSVISVDEPIGDDEDSTSASAFSSSPFGRRDPVPFQELIDTAIGYMRRIPPRQLLKLAKSYYSPEAIDPMLSHTDDIKLLKSPADWALQGTTPADWVLKQRAREASGMRKSSRRDRKRTRSRSRSRQRSLSKEKGKRRGGEETVKSKDEPSSVPTEPQAEENDKPKEVKKDYVTLHKDSMAVLACGLGVGDDEIRRRRRKRRRRLMLGGLVVFVATLSCVAVMQYSSRVSRIEGGENFSSTTALGEGHAGAVDSLLGDGSVAVDVELDMNGEMRTVMAVEQPASLASLGQEASAKGNVVIDKNAEESSSSTAGEDKPNRWLNVLGKATRAVVRVVADAVPDAIARV